MQKLIRSALIAIGLVLAVPASASHYFIVDIADRFSPLALAEFTRFGLDDTEDVLRNLDTHQDREDFASVTGIAASELYEIARMCELLQIEGVGPRAFDLLYATGVQNAEDLAGRDGASLLAEMEVVNASEQLTGVDPPLELVEAWIERATSVPIRVQY